MLAHVFYAIYIYIYIYMDTYGGVPLPPGHPRPPGGGGSPRLPDVGGAGLIAGLLSTVPTGVLLGAMLEHAPSNAAQAADESNTSAAAAEPVGPQAMDGEWVFMPSSTRLLLEHFDFELSNAESESQIGAGSATRRLSRCIIDESDVLPSLWSELSVLLPSRDLLHV
jgi:hypothetical protein